MATTSSFVSEATMMVGTEAAAHKRHRFADFLRAYEILPINSDVNDIAQPAATLSTSQAVPVIANSPHTHKSQTVLTTHHRRASTALFHTAATKIAAVFSGLRNRYKKSTKTPITAEAEMVVSRPEKGQKASEGDSHDYEYQYKTGISNDKGKQRGDEVSRSQAEIAVPVSVRVPNPLMSNPAPGFATAAANNPEKYHGIGKEHDPFVSSNQAFLNMNPPRERKPVLSDIEDIEDIEDEPAADHETHSTMVSGGQKSLTGTVSTAGDNNGTTRYRGQKPDGYKYSMSEELADVDAYGEGESSQAATVENDLGIADGLAHSTQNNRYPSPSSSQSTSLATRDDQRIPLAAKNVFQHPPRNSGLEARENADDGRAAYAAALPTQAQINNRRKGYNTNAGASGYGLGQATSQEDYQQSSVPIGNTNGESSEFYPPQGQQNNQQMETNRPVAGTHGRNSSSQGSQRGKFGSSIDYHPAAASRVPTQPQNRQALPGSLNAGGNNHAQYSLFPGAQQRIHGPSASNLSGVTQNVRAIPAIYASQSGPSTTLNPDSDARDQRRLSRQASTPAFQHISNMPTGVNNALSPSAFIAAQNQQSGGHTGAQQRHHGMPGASNNSSMHLGVGLQYSMVMTGNNHSMVNMSTGGGGSMGPENNGVPSVPNRGTGHKIEVKETLIQAFNHATIVPYGNSDLRVSDVSALASYNTMKDKRYGVFVPGAPDFWTEPEVPFQLPTYGIPTTATTPVPHILPYVPMLAAIAVMAPDHKLHSRAIVTDHESMLQLISYCKGEAQLAPWEIKVDYINGTLFLFTDKKREPGQGMYINPSNVHVAAMKEHGLKNIELPNRSDKHYQIIKYRLGNFTFIVKVEAAGYYKPVAFEAAPPPPVRRRKRDFLERWAESLQRFSDRSQHRLAPGYPERSLWFDGLEVIMKGRVVEFNSIFDLKLQQELEISENEKEIRNREAWASQLQRRLKGMGHAGRFTKIVKEDPFVDVGFWQSDNQLVIKKMIALLNEIKLAVGNIPAEVSGGHFALRGQSSSDSTDILFYTIYDEKCLSRSTKAKLWTAAALLGGD